MKQREANDYHKSYMAASPEYQGTIARFGRMLTEDRVRGILAAHGFSIADFINDDNDPVVPEPGTLPALTDAAALYAWLGY